jgi:hypothetical protein
MDNMADIITVMYTLATTLEEDDPRRTKLLDAAADLEVIRQAIDHSMYVIESFVVTVGVMLFDMSLDDLQKAEDPLAEVIERMASSNKMRVH